MKKSRRLSKKSKAKTGRPKTTGSGTAMMVRMHDPQLKEVDSWIGKSGISRPEAIRQLVAWALQHTKPKVAADSIVRRAQGDERRL